MKTNAGEQLRIVVALAGGDGVRHLAYPTARRTICLELGAFRALRGRGQHSEPTCERCAAGRTLIKEKLRGYRRVQGAHGANRFGGPRAHV